MTYPTTEQFSIYFTAERIERFKEGQAFLRWYDSVPTEKVRQFDDGGGVGHWVKLNARKKA
jgi:hypothetical protein